MDYAMLSQTQLQSSSDQSGYKKIPSILVGETAAALVPEQLAAWSFPTSGCDARETSFDMVSGMLCRIMLSGNLDKLSKESFDEVQKGIEIYKSEFAPFIHKSLPFFPSWDASITDDINPVSVGLKNGNKEYIAVWRLKGDKSVNIPIVTSGKVKLVYPDDLNIKLYRGDDNIKIEFPEEYMGAILEVNN